MSDQTVAVKTNTDIDTPQFLLDLVPAGEKTALLFHISYLCLGKFSELEKIVRQRAVDVQHAFSASEALLLKCISTSGNLVENLFPKLRVCVEKNKSVLAIKILEKARDWIGDIIANAEDMVKKYETLSKDVANATSDVHKKKIETEQQITKLTKEQEELQKNVKTYEDKVKEKTAALSQNEKDIETATQELKNTINEIAGRNKKFGIVAAVIPFLGSIINAAQKSINNSKDQARLEVARDKVNDLRSKRAMLSREVGQSETELMHWNFKLTQSYIDLGAVPDPVHLPEVQQCLTKIQEILIKLKGFWEKIEVWMEDLKQKTFSAEDFVPYLEDFGQEFLESIEVASKAWVKFGKACSLVSGIFSLKNKDAYNFLRKNVEDMKPEDWQKEYDDVKARLDAFYKKPEIQAIEEGEEQEQA